MLLKTVLTVFLKVSFSLYAFTTIAINPAIAATTAATIPITDPNIPTKAPTPTPKAPAIVVSPANEVIKDPTNTSNGP